jgi:type III pantothenate kinase
MPGQSATLVAVDIGNSRIKLGQFDAARRSAQILLPAEPLELTVAHRTGEFDLELFDAWCRKHAAGEAIWRLSSVHRRATERLTAAASTTSKRLGYRWKLHQIAHREVPLATELDQPERVGMDRLLGGVAANHFRTPGRAAIVADLGTATKVDLVTSDGVFAGGAILPGLAISACALEEQTDALPHIDVEHWTELPLVPGKSTVPAIEAGLFWGTVGAIREISNRYARELQAKPDFFITGGSAPLVADVLAQAGDFTVCLMPHLVLSGIALVDQAAKAEDGPRSTRSA